MWPKEHGAYGQLLFPLITALAVGRPTAPAVLLSAAALLAFIAHEPFLVLIGQRGTRAARDLRATAGVWFGVAASGATACGVAAVVIAPASVRLALVGPAALGATLLAVILARREHSGGGEILTALTLSSLALPVGLAAGAPPTAATTCAAAFGAVFVSGTVGVRAVIAHTRRPPAKSARAGAGLVAVGMLVLLQGIASMGLGARSAPWAALPVCLLAVLLAIAPPSAQRLRTVGWALVATTVATATLLMVTLRQAIG
jgi:hypothetical protein